jgi:pSer/pThr/pTyr-binding forkhead associated (FHA) protein
MDENRARMQNSVPECHSMKKKRRKKRNTSLGSGRVALPGNDLKFPITKVISREKFTEKIPFRERAFFEILGENGKNKTVELGSDEVVIGRGSGCGIRLDEDSVSRRHSRVVFRNEEYQIEDLNSTNGVYVNGVRVVKCVLRNNDQIEIGGVRLIFNEEKTLKGR